MDLLSGNLPDLDLRSNLELLLSTVRDAGDRSLDPLFTTLARRDAALLAEVSCGPRSPGGPALARAALRQRETLEKLLSARGFYPRLAELAGAAAPEVLQVAVEHYPTAPWIIQLSRKVESAHAGYAHLMATLDHPDFPKFCIQHADAGHAEGLSRAALKSGRCEPVAALLNVDQKVALRAAAEMMERWPQVPLIPYLAEVWGPDMDGLVIRLLPRLRSRTAARGLARFCSHLPRSRSLLDRLMPGILDR